MKRRRSEKIHVAATRESGLLVECVTGDWPEALPGAIVNPHDWFATETIREEMV
jgi:hypothetical protein